MGASKERRAKRRRYNEKWDVMVSKLALLTPSVYEDCRRYAHNLQGVPQVWVYPAWDDAFKHALKILGVELRDGPIDTDRKVRQLLHAFKRVSPKPESPKITRSHYGAEFLTEIAPMPGLRQLLKSGQLAEMYGMWPKSRWAK
jgi:hypothetical protein